MFTGIIEAQGSVISIENLGSGKQFWLSCPFADELGIDESLAHDGACLTISGREPGRYAVIAIEETLRLTTLGGWNTSSSINLERSMPATGRFDGHLVQGHVDAVGRLEQVDDRNGSWLMRFSFPPQCAQLLVDKGSVCLNGISLTVFDTGPAQFTVAIIPYIWQHTNLGTLRINDLVNLEFDIVGKYILKSQGMAVGPETSPAGWKDIE